MNKIIFLIKFGLLSPSKHIKAQTLGVCIRQCSTKDGESSGDGKSDKKQKSEEALKKLNSLLKQMVEADEINSSKLDLARPKSKKDNAIKKKNEKEEPAEQRIVNAAKDVAQSLGGNVKRTESELLSKLLNSVTEEKDSDKQTVSTNLSEIVRGMKIDRESKAPEEMSRAKQVRTILEMSKGKDQDKKPFEKSSYRTNLRSDAPDALTSYEKIDLFGAKPLGIFSSHDEPQEEINRTWKILYERELKLAITHPPTNYFQEMILWTQQGKLWKFPIDNEQGMDEEKEIYFAEHVFLDKHLEPWCPPKGPIRHFMELVCVGLSKNPYMSVKHKKEHIEWYREYFSQKVQLLQDVGAIPPEFDVNKLAKLE